jgi:N-acyl homoserine lactone hydrolase
VTSVRRLYILLVGFEILPKSVSTKDIGSRFTMSSPICCYLLDTQSGWILLDGGYDPVYSRDPVLAERYFGSTNMYPPVVEPEHEIEFQLGEIGIGLGDIKQVVLSHLHLDHTGYVKQLKHAQVYIQRVELAHGFTDARPVSYFPADYDAADIDWQQRDGDWELVPGVRFIATRGHTPGHQSAVIELPDSGTIVLPFDAGDLQENFDSEILPGETVDDEAALVSIRKLKALAAAPRSRMILFHDPVAIQGYKLAPEFYD